jgi:hypothetical protein
MMPHLMSNIVLARKPEFGGVTMLVSGALGTGKTSFLCHVARRVLERQAAGEAPPELVFWREERGPCQWYKFLDHRPEVPVKVLVPEGEVEFIGEDSPRYETFRTFTELYRKAERGKINVFYLDDERLVGFLEHLENRTFGWASVFLDEVEGLAPYGASGAVFRTAKRFKDVLKHARKSRLSVYADTQAAQDVFWQALSKFKAYGFLQGSRPLPWTPVWKSAIAALEVGEAWVTVGGFYEKVKFPPYVLRTDVRAVVSWETRPTAEEAGMGAGEAPPEEIPAEEPEPEEA